MQSSFACSVCALVICVVTASTVGAQPDPPPTRTGAEVYRSACSACHGADGRGTQVAQLGFNDVAVPDFTDCSFSSVEPAADWAAVVHAGGPVRSFSRRMPAFGEALTEEEIVNVVDHIRGFCRSRKWPRGDLNLPRALVTEKAYPENEAVVTTTISRSDRPSVEHEFLYERRLGARSQYEIIVPLTVQKGDREWYQGLGDIAVALKHALFDSSRSGTIVSAGAEARLPTGKEEYGLGDGIAVAEAFGVVSQMLPRDGFLHFHAGVEVPVASATPNETFWRLALGKTFSQNRWGRAWSPILEVLGAKDLGAGESPEWDLVPQMQVSLSTRQHILINVGVRVPVGDRSERRPTLITYFLWDWFDGGLLSGW